MNILLLRCTLFAMSSPELSLITLCCKALLYSSDQLRMQSLLKNSNRRKYRVKESVAVLAMTCIWTTRVLKLYLLSFLSLLFVSYFIVTHQLWKHLTRYMTRVYILLIAV